MKIQKPHMVMRCYKPTQYTWFPAFGVGDDLLVEVSINGKTVSAWGADDFGLSKDFKSNSEALYEFMKLMEMPFVNPDRLRNMGYLCF